MDIYFVAGKGNADCKFRVSAKEPELWDPGAEESIAATDPLMPSGLLGPVRLEFGHLQKAQF